MFKYKKSYGSIPPSKLAAPTVHHATVSYLSGLPLPRPHTRKKSALSHHVKKSALPRHRHFNFAKQEINKEEFKNEDDSGVLDSDEVEDRENIRTPVNTAQAEAAPLKSNANDDWVTLSDDGISISPPGQPLNAEQKGIEIGNKKNRAEIYEDGEERELQSPATQIPTPMPIPIPPGMMDQKLVAIPHKDVFSQHEKNSLNHSMNQQEKSLAKEYTRLSLQFESALIQHKLALEYFDFRAFYFVFLPVTLIATSITIIGFLISGNTQDDNGANANGDDGSAEDSVGDFDPLLTGHSKQIFSLVVGILGAISTLLNAIGKRTNYQSQSDMHRAAVKALEKISLNVEFEREWFDRKVGDLDLDIGTAGCNDDKKLAEKVGAGAADLKSHQASFKAMLDACCDSPVPYEVAQAFTLLEQIFCLNVYDEGGSDLRPLMYHYHKLWKEYSKYWLWPLKAPSIKVSKKVKEWKKERANNGVDDDEGNKCGCFCCGKYWGTGE